METTRSTEGASTNRRGHIEENYQAHDMSYKLQAICSRFYINHTMHLRIKMLAKELFLVEKENLSIFKITKKQ